MTSHVVVAIGLGAAFGLGCVVVALLSAAAVEWGFAIIVRRSSE